MRNEIAMCCGTPLIWTFCFSHAEYYCRKCGANIGMMGVRGVETTPKLERESEENEKWFKDIMDDHIPFNCKFDKCEECQKPGSTYHHQHATPEQLEKSKQALEILKEGRLQDANS